MDRKPSRKRPNNKVMKTKPFIAILLILFLALPKVALAQDETQLKLSLSRDNGFGLGNQMQGKFSYRVSGPENLVRVEFLMDGEVIGESTEEPFRLRFVTDDYELGRHELSAVGYTADNQIIESNTFIGEFVSPQITSTFTFAVVGFVIVVIVARFLFFRQGSDEGKKGYGAFGAAVCKNCGRPFSRHWWGLNLLATRYDRCSHCGKWQGTQAANADELAAAEAFAKELDGDTDAAPVSEVDSAEKLRKQLDDSRFEDL